MIDWYLMPTLAIFQLYRGINKFYCKIGQNRYKIWHYYKT